MPNLENDPLISDPPALAREAEALVQTIAAHLRRYARLKTAARNFDGKLHRRRDVPSDVLAAWEIVKETL